MKQQQQQIHNHNSKKVSVSLTAKDFFIPLEIVYNNDNNNGTGVKNWLWDHYKDDIFDALTIECHMDDNNNGNEEDEEKSLLAVQNTTTATTKQQRHDTLRNSNSLSSVMSKSFQRRQDLLDTIAKVQRQFFQNESPKVVFGCLLEGLLDLMDSAYGFIGEVKFEEGTNTMYLQTHAITNIAWNEATSKFYDDNINSGLKFWNLNSLFGTVMTTKQPVIANDPKNDPRAAGIPEGHPPLNHFLGIPFFKTKSGEMNGMVGISNKPGGYTPEDVEFLEPFVVTCSNLIQAYWQMEQNRNMMDTLETSVKTRTQELQRANQK